MPKKLNYSYVKKYIEVESESGCKLLSDEYINSATPLKIQCHCGNVFYRSFNEFKNKKLYKCHECVAKDHHNKIYNEERINKIIELYKNGYKMSEISKIVNTKPEIISNILKSHNIPIRNNTNYRTSKELATGRKYKFNEDFFEKIDNEIKAYWLGFLYADGNVYIPNMNIGKTKGGTIEISLKKEDDYHLYNFVNDINGNIPIKYRKVKLNDNSYDACRVLIGSIKMASDLINKGCVPHKSLILTFPNIEIVPESLLNHFIRGYIDGDGSVVFNTYETYDNFFVSLLGTRDFLEGVKNTLEKNNIKCSNIKSSKSKAYILNIYGANNLTKLYNYLYTNATRFLGRKLDKYRNALVYYEKQFNISDVSRLFVEMDNELQSKIFYKKNIRNKKQFDNVKMEGLIYDKKFAL